jgi:hypothetical protein
MKSSAQDLWRGAVPGKRLHLRDEHHFVAEKRALGIYLCECRPA